MARICDWSPSQLADISYVIGHNWRLQYGSVIGNFRSWLIYLLPLVKLLLQADVYAVTGQLCS